MALTDKINDGFRQLATLVKGKVDKTAVIAIANGGTGATTLSSAQTALGVDKVVSANTRLTTAKQTFPNAYVDSNGQLQKTQLATWLDHAKMYNGLVPNGSFQMGDATGWVTDANKTFITADFPFGAFGCLRCVNNASFDLDKIAINPYQSYRHSIMAKYEITSAGANGIYFGIKQYDVDGNDIMHHHSNHRLDTITTLAQDLRVGDTKVYLASVSNWIATGWKSDSGFKFYNYVDSRGYLYDPSTMPYSRYVTYKPDGWWSTQSDIDTTNNVITLNTAWNYPNPKDPEGVWRAGTKIAQCLTGGTWYYNLLAAWMSGKTGITPWTYFTSTISGVNTTGKDDVSKFRAGTAYVAPFCMGNPKAGDVFKLSHHYFEKI